MKKHIQAGEQDAEIMETFIWEQDGTSKIFPVDYSERELAEKLGIGTRKIRSHIIKQSPMSNALEKLIMEDEKERYEPLPVEKRLNRKERDFKEDTPGTESSIVRKGAQKIPLPLEVIPFLEAYLKLETTSYKNVFEHGYDGRDERISAFVQDLCKELAAIVLSDIEDCGSDRQEEYSATRARSTETACPEIPAKDIFRENSAFMRHALFYNRTFNNFLFEGLWENEVQTRIDRIYEKVRKLPSDQRSAFLKSMLITLDRHALSLSFVDEGGSVASLYTEDDLKSLFDALLIKRVKVKLGRGGFAEYEVQNSRFVDSYGQENSMQNSFADLSRCWKRRTEDDWNCVRAQYLRSLGATTMPSLAEKKYLEIYRYLREFPRTEYEVKAEFVNFMKKWGQAKIDYCTATSFDSLADYGGFEDSHIKSLIKIRALENTNWFWPTIEISRALSLIKMVRDGERKLLADAIRSEATLLKETSGGQGVLGEIAAGVADVANAAANKYENGNIGLNSPQFDGFSRTYISPFFYYFAAACQFLFGDSMCYVSNKGVLDTKLVADIFSKNARLATEYFDRPEIFPYSVEEVERMLDQCNEWRVGSGSVFSLDVFLQFSSGLLVGILAQIFYKIAEDSDAKKMNATLENLWIKE